MGASSRIGRLLAILVIGVAALLLLDVLPDNEPPEALGTPVVAARPRPIDPASPMSTAGTADERRYRERLATPVMFIHARRREEGEAVYPSYVDLHDATFSAEVRGAFVPLSSVFDTTSTLDALGRAGGIAQIRMDPIPTADSLLRHAAAANGGLNVDFRLDVHGSLSGHVIPSWIVALAPNTSTPLALTPWGSKGQERALAEGRRLASLVSDDTVSALHGVPFRVVSYDRFDIDTTRYVVVHAVRESKRHPGDVEIVGEVVTLIGQALGATDEFAPVWSSMEVSPTADMTLAPVVAALRMGTARRPVLLLEVQGDDPVCAGDRRGIFLALMDDGRWHDVGFWGPGC